MSDILITGISPKSKIRFTFADVTVSAKALEARHLSGPTAGMILAEALTAVALLSNDLSSDDECISLQMKLSGPVRGLLAESMGTGSLRGYTHAKVLNDLDGNDVISSAEGLGDSGVAQIITSLPGKVLNQAQLKVDPPEIRTVLARYYNHSMQTPTAAEISVKANCDGLILARGITVERMPDGDHETFIHALEQFDSKKVAEMLSDNADWSEITKHLKLGDAEQRMSKPLHFACRCSMEKALNIVQALDVNELKAMAEDNKPHNIICHMCGEDYMIKPETIKEILLGRD